MTPFERKIKVFGEVIKQIALQAISLTACIFVFQKTLSLSLSRSITPLMLVCGTIGPLVLLPILSLSSLSLINQHNLDAAIDYGSHWSQVRIHPDLYCF